MKTSKKYVRVFAGAVCAAVMMSGAVVSAETFATVKGGGLNLRETASLDARVLGQYPTGTWITILEKGDTWHKVTVDGKTGYMMNKYLTPVPAQTVTTPTDLTPVTLPATGDTITLTLPRNAAEWLRDALVNALGVG